MNERPTPETDAHILGGSYSFDVEFARRLERERDEAREAVAMLNERLIQRTADMLSKIVEIETRERENAQQWRMSSVCREKDAEIQAMREAIKEVHALLKDCSGRASDMTITIHADDHAKGCVDDVWEWSEAALAKLQPFIKL